jgi:hypothetical protein
MSSIDINTAPKALPAYPTMEEVAEIRHLVLMAKRSGRWRNSLAPVLWAAMAILTALMFVTHDDLHALAHSLL